MTIRGKHLVCDNRGLCISCSNYILPPNIDYPNKYYHCRNCNIDIICKQGLTISFDYDEYNMEKAIKCSRCGGKMDIRIWPKKIIIEEQIE